MVYDPYPMCYDLIHMGNKAYTLAKLYNLGFRVPPAFVITTEYFRCRSVIESLNPPREDFEQRVMDYIGKLEGDMGRRFACPQNPLLLSVRSGSAVSMPGMMNTFLNVGINEQIVEGLIAQTGEGWFAWDNYRRFLQSWGMSFGMERNEFDAIMNHYKKRYRRQVKREFLPEEIRELALAYRQAILDRHIDFSEDPREPTLHGYPAGDGFLACAQGHHLPGDHGALRKLGNGSDHPGHGVWKPGHTFGGWCDVHPRPLDLRGQSLGGGRFHHGQSGRGCRGGIGEDPAPVRSSTPQSGGTKGALPRDPLSPSLPTSGQDRQGPHLRSELGTPGIEFTFQGDREENVYILQSRDMSPRHPSALPRPFELPERLHNAYVGSGIGVSGGALSGVAAFDLESISRLRKEHVENR